MRREVEIPRISAAFIFQRMWIDHVDFKRVVATDWARPVAGTPGVKLWRKLARLKHTLKRWNWTTFGDIFKKKAELLYKIQTLETELQAGWSDQIHSEWDLARKDFGQVEACEHELLCHKACMNWIKDGDKNSAFYHAVIKDKKKRQMIQIARDDDSLTTNEMEIGALAQDFFLDLFTASTYHLDQDLFEGILPGLSEGDNESFTVVPSPLEINEAIGQMNQVVAARKLRDYRPISLGNFSGKIISKILAMRNRPALYRIDRLLLIVLLLRSSFGTCPGKFMGLMLLLRLTWPKHTIG